MESVLSQVFFYIYLNLTTVLHQGGILMLIFQLEKMVYLSWVKKLINGRVMISTQMFCPQVQHCYLLNGCWVCLPRPLLLKEWFEAICNILATVWKMHNFRPHPSPTESESQGDSSPHADSKSTKGSPAYGPCLDYCPQDVLAHSRAPTKA